MKLPFDESLLEGLHPSPEGGRACYGYVNCLLMKMYIQPHPEWDLSDLIVLGLSKNHQAKWYFMIKDPKKFYSYLNKFLEDQSQLKSFEDFIKNTSQSFIKEVKSKEIPDLSIKQLSNLISSYYNHFLQIVRAAGLARWIDRALIIELKNISDRRALGNEGTSILSVSERKTFSVQEHLALLNLANKASKLEKKDLKKELEKIKDNFSWSTLGYYNESPKDLKSYEEELKSLTKNNPKKLLKEFISKAEEGLQKRKEAIKKLSTKEREMADLAASLTYLKDYYKSSINEMEYYAEPFFLEIVKRTGKNIDFIKDLLPEETISLLSGKKIDTKIVEDRTKSSISISVHDIHSVLSGKEADYFEKKYLIFSSSDVKEFRGRVACKGFVKGHAKIILSPADFGKFNKGDIIVAPNTSPDYVPLMKKAAAIIAEEGGLTAHASVVSRELGVPCIVGITRASTIFKDNEMLEVDANKGIIKRI